MWAVFAVRVDAPLSVVSIPTHVGCIYGVSENTKLAGFQSPRMWAVLRRARPGTAECIFNPHACGLYKIIRIDCSNSDVSIPTHVGCIIPPLHRLRHRWFQSPRMWAVSSPQRAILCELYFNPHACGLYVCSRFAIQICYFSIPTHVGCIRSGPR